MKKKIVRIALMLSIVIMVFSTCFLLVGCNNYDYYKDGELAVTMHPYDPRTNEEIKEGDTIQMTLKEFNMNEFILIRYEVEREKKLISKENKFSKKMQVSYEELNKLLVVRVDCDCDNVYKSRWGSHRTFRLEPDTYNITIEFSGDNRYYDVYHFWYQPSVRFKHSSFNFQVEIIE